MSLASRKVSVDRADLGIRHLLVSPGLLRLSRLGQFRRVAFTNPFTDRGADLRLLNLSRPPHSRRPLTRDAVSRLAERPRSGPALTRWLWSRSWEARRTHHQPGRSVGWPAELTLRQRQSCSQVHEYPRVTVVNGCWPSCVAPGSSSQAPKLLYRPRRVAQVLGDRPM